MRRVVVTGLGMVTPLASGVEATWARLIAGESGAGPLDRFDASAIACRIAAEGPWTDGTGGGKALLEAGETHAVFHWDPDLANVGAAVGGGVSLGRRGAGGEEKENQRNE